MHVLGLGKLRSPTKRTVGEALDALIAGMKDGTIPTRSGDRYKPSAIRGYKRAVKLRLKPELGRIRLSELHRRDVQAMCDRLAASCRTQPGCSAR